MDRAFSEGEALNELLIAALSLCMQIKQLEAAEHVLEALRVLERGEADEGGRHVGFE
jgi:hypothetical protein